MREGIKWLSQKLRKIEDLIKNQISFILEFSLFCLNLEKLHVFQNYILGLGKCSYRSKYFI